MKTVRFTLAILLTISSFGLFTSCDNDDDIHDDGVAIAYNDLPAKSKSFIADNFNNFSVQSARQTATSYDVSLAQNTIKSTFGLASAYEIKFDLGGVWLEIEAGNDGALPDNVLALLPRSITSYLAQNYPTRGVSEIDKVYNGYKIDLAGNPDIELLFDINGAYLGADKENNNNAIDVEGLPTVSKTFLQTHFAGINTVKVSKDSDSYDVRLANNAEVEFNLLGEWIEIDANNTNMPASVLALLPQGITSYLNTKYPSKRIEDITKKASSYKLELAGNIELSFDSEGNLWGTNENNNNNNTDDERLAFDKLPERAKSIINQHFLSGASVLYVEKDSNEYEVKLSDGTDIQFDLQGNLTSVEVLPGKKVPDALIPEKIRSYVTMNYANKQIVEFESKLVGYQVQLSGYPEIELLFDLNGNFKSIDR